MPIKTIVRNARLLSGLILMGFVVCHLANLSIGLHSLEAMERWRVDLVGPWQTPLGGALLGFCALLHAGLGIYAIAVRHTLAMSRTDAVQLFLGVLTPPLLVSHVVVMGTAANLVKEFEPSYGQILTVYWSVAPALAFQQLFAVLFVWVHAAIGLYSWLVLKPVWRRIGGLVVPLLFAVPIIALLGFAEAGKEVLAKLAQDGAWRDATLAMIHLLDPVRAELNASQMRIVSVYGVFVLLGFVVFAVRRLYNRLSPVRIDYGEGLSALGRRGFSVLEVSRANAIPHADVCSGRARCGTCRVRVESGAEKLSAISDIERATLARVGAAAGDRLACQARVLASGVTVTRLLPAYADASAARHPDDWAEGEPDPAGTVTR